MSEVYGTGYGSAHDWRRTNRATMPAHDYKCQRCGAHFTHDFAAIPNIWTAIQRGGVREVCARPSLTGALKRKAA